MPPLPRCRRVVSAAAGHPGDVENPEALPSTQPSGSTEGVQQTTEIIAQVTCEVLRQLREDRSALPGTRDPLPVPEDDVLPAKDVGTHVTLTGHPSTSSAEDQMDGAVAGTINSLLRGDVGEQIIPQSIPLHTTELGTDLSDRILSKIWANEYVDFFELINKVQPQQMTVSTGYSHQIISVMPQSKGRQISTIDQWTSAFLVFGAVYTQRFPEVGLVCLSTAKLFVILSKRGHRLLGCSMTNNFARSDNLTLQTSLGTSIGGTYSSGVCTLDKSRWGWVLPQPLFPTNQPVTPSPCRYMHVCSKCQALHPASSCRQRNAPNPNKP